VVTAQGVWRHWVAAAASGAVLLVMACKPNLDMAVSVIDGPRVIGVRADPAEGEPRAGVVYSVLYVDPTGDVPSAAVRWDFCTAPKPLAELGPVNAECQQAGAASWFTPIAIGEQVMATLPKDGCQNFGPDVVQSGSGPTPRPVDPDVTGGYYQPIRVSPPDGSITISETRLSCGVNGAGTLSAEFQNRYHLNTNPAVDSLSVVGDDGGAGAALVTADKGTNPVKAGTSLDLRVAWAGCPLTDACGDGVCGPDETQQTCGADCNHIVGCTGAERYVVFDVQSQALEDQREAISLAWYATGGSFDNDNTGRADTDFATTSDNVWHAPSSTGTVHLWAVLTDNRGGTGWAEYVFDVQ
jgi:hypothetical protein